ncbi:thiol:disulfide oxidoreductase [Sphingomonas melonis TY]|jgi:GST-like protein|nr:MULTISPECIES: glutathione-dependent disulfide-bond oxidoreductase [Sphingomonas]AOW24956.1 glutathione-dependent disulfide-bond oxidoreductase [Sphingomonas melonis TY]ATI57009.1 glutathione-dependent disulfide-bond oxidoreductase [Sphingomonas melonis]KZB96276.1 thiol:disulfide oxidoreductase [Sphingomonas melonis TY]MBI0533367.1 glutathione-dependent disulfide-bond oxidoreductase [Sphingomonas sp. TX0522]MBX8845570.1 glutathione-dependent disulfide-bond oxidoreductase [Sphingomonas meloni
MADDTSANNQPAGYVPPEVWTWNPGNGGQFASINRPISGATQQRDLPTGDHGLQLYSLGTPNGQKVTIMLEELLAAGHAGAEYDAWPIEIGKGDQFGSGFVAINPNSKIPALLDRRSDPPLHLFESGSILIHLAESFGAFLPASGPARVETLNWLMWQMGSAPFVGGGFGHFYAYAPFRIEYAIDRYAMEAKRQLHVLDTRLADNAFLAGDDYTIADIAAWPWYGGLMDGIYSAQKFLSVEDYPNVRRWTDTIAAREGVRRGRIVNRLTGAPGTFLAERHSAADVDRALAEGHEAA